ncbi:PREDICTED: placenta-specific protein 9 isoform X1 [Gavialis gangeticus]|uniref:placenta-specific protein 9 isoform X1 n=1 Tax=Gavialis gangeticus TaxID=94835 RepID=UPI00092F039D|nr:PREDICTED: placenta-specific protein 9 isoform X1 [Gavialis gangeticus]
MLFIWALAFILVPQEQGFWATADPVSMSPGSSQGTEWCNDHNTIHRRLDVIEEQVEKTVDYLDSEVKALLNTISETAWNVPVPPGTPVKDIFDDAS